MTTSRLPVVGIVLGAFLAAGVPAIAAGASAQAIRRGPGVSRDGRAAPPPSAGRVERALAIARENAPAPPPPSSPPPSEGGQAVPRHPGAAPAPPPPSTARPRSPSGGSEGTAMPRPEGQRPRVYERDRDRDHRPYGYYYPYAGVGLGYFYPYWWSYPSLWSPGYYGDYYDPYAGGYASGYAPEESSGIHLKMKPREASVYVDGYYVGTVNDFDGIFQKLKVDPGPHRIEVREPGYAPVSFNVDLQPGQTITYKGDLEKRP